MEIVHPKRFGHVGISCIDIINAQIRPINYGLTFNINPIADRSAQSVTLDTETYPLIGRKHLILKYDLTTNLAKE